LKNAGKKFTGVDNSNWEMEAKIVKKRLICSVFPLTKTAV
jgi:hypothetical protein